MKKICSLIIILSAFHFAASAQYTQGKIYIDGSVNYNNDKMNVATQAVGAATKSTSNNLIISPNIGYFVSDNFAIGVGLEYKSLSSSNTTLTNSNYSNSVLTSQIFDEYSNKWNELAPTLFAKYIIPVSDKLSFSLKAKFSHGLVTDNVTITSTTVDYDAQGNGTNQPASTIVSEKPSKQTNRFNLSPEFQYLITEKVGVQVNFTGLSYSSVPVINNAYQTTDGSNFSQKINYGTQKSISFSLNPSSWSFGVFFLLGKGSESKEIKKGE